MFYIPHRSGTRSAGKGALYRLTRIHSPQKRHKVDNCISVPAPGARTSVIIVVVVLTAASWLLLTSGASVESVAILLGAITASVAGIARFVCRPGPRDGKEAR